MLKEQTIFFITMLINLIIASIKLISGTLFGLSSLVADSFQTYTDFITDIISMIASKVGKKRANKKYPFGYGMIENISNLFIGLLLMLLSLFIFIQSFKIKEVEVNLIIFVILIIVIILKTIIFLYLYTNGKNNNNQSMIVSAKESSMDLISTIIVLIVSILLLFQNNYPVLKYSDMIGSIIISLIIFYTAIRIVIENIAYLLGSSEENKEILNEIENIIKNYKLIKDSHIKLMRIGAYYNLYLTIELEETVTLKKLFQLDNNLKKDIKHICKKIRFIEIEPKKYH